MKLSNEEMQRKLQLQGYPVLFILAMMTWIGFFAGATTVFLLVFTIVSTFLYSIPLIEVIKYGF